MKKQRRPDFKERSFGVSVGGVVLLVAAVLWWRGRLGTAEILAGIGGVLVILGLTAPKLLYYPSAVWWKFAMVLGHINARVILTIAFLFVLTPMALIWRLIGRDPLAIRKQHWAGWSPYPARYRDKDHFTRMY
jgi:multisubunit Na+/H+ antiporter MnhG subunit